MPCVLQPELHDGLADEPSYVVSMIRFTDLPLAYETSPFQGTTDVHDVERLTLEHTANGLEHVGIFAVHQRIEGATQVPPERPTVVS